MLLAFIVGLIGLIIHIYFKYLDSVKKRKETVKALNKRRKKRKSDFGLLIDFTTYVKDNKERIVGSAASYIILFFIMYYKVYLKFDFLNWLAALDSGTYTVYFVIGYFADSIIRNVLVVINNIKIPDPLAETADDEQK